jgi:hypothetical protein
MGTGFTLEEHLENGETIVLGEPFFDLMVAKVIASQRALRTGRPVVVKDSSTGNEIVRYQSNGAPSVGSVKRMRAIEDVLGELHTLVRQRNSA